MLNDSRNRHNFSKLALAAFGGVVAGTLAINVPGCSSQPEATSNTPAASSTAASAGGDSAEMSRAETHACKGLNACKGQGAEGNNACAGQGGCATASMHHECKGMNACKGQGGCGEAMGTNACKGEGGCAIPMKDHTAWLKARESFEARMKAAGKEVGPAPAKS